MGTNILALAWGFAEATVFFIVPDALLTGIALHSLRRALIGCLYAVLGALIGGTLMYTWGSLDLPSALTVLDWLPAIAKEMLENVRDDLHERGLLALAIGPAWGAPYKVFAVQAHAAGIGLIPFLAISIPARLWRFVLVTLAAWFLSARVFSGLAISIRYLILVVSWIAFYALYFCVVAGRCVGPG